jgi:hypothetical protein
MCDLEKVILRQRKEIEELNETKIKYGILCESLTHNEEQAAIKEREIEKLREEIAFCKRIFQKLREKKMAEHSGLADE